MLQHLAFIRKFEKVAIVVTVVDLESLEGIPNESFVVCTTRKSFTSGMMPSITISDQVFDTDEDTKGNSIDGILTSPNWFIRKVTTGLEDLLGG
jgi:hypothetical protein